MVVGMEISTISCSRPKSKADPSLYIFGDITSIGGRPIILYVDDISMAYPSNATAAVKDIKAKKDHELRRRPPISWD